ncbi:MAG: hypothetical protein ALAOOOJD_03194 [bacterium]|nr:hypothetical protein [bacterium]
MHVKTTQAGLLLLLAAIWLMGCADVPSTGPTPPDLISEYRFVNAAGDLGNVGISVDGASVGNVAFKGVVPYTQFPAGSRLAVLSTGDSVLVSMDSYKRGTVVILPKTGPVREIIKLFERRVFDPVNTNTALLRFVHAAQAPELFVKITGASRTVRLNNRTFNTDSGYLELPAGNYTISVAAASDTATVLASATLAAANKRQTSIILGSVSAQTLALVNLADD